MTAAPRSHRLVPPAPGAQWSHADRVRGPASTVVARGHPPSPSADGSRNRCGRSRPDLLPPLLFS
jgi:hypothetical protein